MEIHRGPPRQYLNYPPVKKVRGKNAGERQQKDIQELWIWQSQ